jgi:hypothetical protein
MIGAHEYRGAKVEADENRCTNHLRKQFAMILSDMNPAMNPEADKMTYALWQAG